MIEHYTIKFGPAVSQKELEKALDESDTEDNSALSRVHKTKARIEVIADFQDIKSLATILKDLSKRNRDA